MGRNARVYKKLANVVLPEELKRHVFVFDESTGELDFERGWENPKSDEFLACDAFIGNMSGVAYLRKRLHELCGDKTPVLLECVLRSGIDSGDHISRPKLLSLGSEIELLQSLLASQEAPDAALKTLAETMEALLSAANAEGTTIMF